MDNLLNFEDFVNENLINEEELYESYLEDEDLINELFGINTNIRKSGVDPIRGIGANISKSHHTKVIAGIGAFTYIIYKLLQSLINQYKNLDKQEIELKDKISKTDNSELKAKLKNELSIVKTKKEDLKEKIKEKKAKEEEKLKKK